jgi:hypothetical protein
MTTTHAALEPLATGRRPRIRARLAGAAVATALIAAGTVSQPAEATSPPSTTVVTWDAVATQAISAVPMSAPDGHVLFAYVGIAMYDAAMSVNPTHEAFIADVDAAPGASADAAVATAAHHVLVHFLPAQQDTILDPAYSATLAGIADGPAKTAGIAAGAEVTEQLLEERAGDGFLDPTTPPPIGTAPGEWIPTSPPPAAPLGMSLADMVPFSLKSDDQFRPSGPPALNSDEWASDYNETKTLGAATGGPRDEYQTLVARFWGEPPVPQAHASFRLFVEQHDLDLFEAARFMAMVEVTVGDAFIACFDAKYHYLAWRPITAIRAGDTDGNADTVGDPAWNPLLGTPNHPEYPSAHSCITPAVGLVAARFLGTQHIDYTVPSVTGLGNRTFATPRELTADVGNGRVWAGIHFRSAVEDGAVIAKRSTNWVLGHNFQPLD